MARNSSPWSRTPSTALRLQVEVAWGGIRERARGGARFCGRTAVGALVGVLVTALLVSAAIWLWARALAVMAGQLDLPPRVRAGERVLTVAATGTVRLTLSFFILWLAAVQSSAPLLIFGLSGIAMFSVIQPIQLRRALRSGRHRRSTAGR